MLAQKTISLIIIIVIGIAINLTIIKLLLSKLYKNVDDKTFNKSSFLIEFTSLFIASSILFSKSIYAANEAIDIILKLRLSNTFFETIKVSAVYFGLNILWLLVLYFVSIPLSSIVIGNRIQKIEMDNNNYSFFIVKGLILLGLVIISLSLQESICRIFIPSISIPIFH
jgi:hypothetical protein